MSEAQTDIEPFEATGDSPTGGVTLGNFDARAGLRQLMHRSDIALALAIVAILAVLIQPMPH